MTKANQDMPSGMGTRRRNKLREAYGALRGPDDYQLVPIPADVPNPEKIEGAVLVSDAWHIVAYPLMGTIQVVKASDLDQIEKPALTQSAQLQGYFKTRAARFPASKAVQNMRTEQDSRKTEAKAARLKARIEASKKRKKYWVSKAKKAANSTKPLTVV